MEMKEILRKNRKESLIIAVISTVVALLNVLGGLSLGNMLTAVGKMEMRGLLKSAFITLLIWTAFYVMYRFQKNLNASAQRKFNNDVRHVWSENSAYMKNAEWEKIDHSSYLAHYMNELSVIDEKYLNSLFNLLYEIPAVIFAFVSILSIHPLLGIVTVLLFLLIFMIPQLFNKKLSENAEKLQKVIADTTAGTDDLIKGRQPFLIYRGKQEYIKCLDSTSDMMESQYYKNRKYENTASCIISSTGLVAQLVLVFTASFLVIEQKTDAGAVLAIGNIAGTFFSSASGTISDYAIMKANRKMLEEIPDSCNKENSNAETFENLEIRKLYRITIDDSHEVNYRLENVKMSKGEKVLITGESGSGKSLLLNLLFHTERKYSGNILLNGRELSTRRLPLIDVTYLPQSPYIFADTLKNNLAMGKNIDESRLLDIIDKLGLNTLKNETDNVLECQISNNGSDISGGEAMRICIARAVLSGKKVLVLDEPFAALDEKTAQKTADYLCSLKNITLVITGHRLNEKITGMFDNVIQLQNKR